MNLKMKNDDPNKFVRWAFWAFALYGALMLVAFELQKQVNFSMQNAIVDAGQMAGISGLILAKTLGMVFHNPKLTHAENKELRKYRYFWVGVTICSGMFLLFRGPYYSGAIEMAKAMLPVGRDPAESFLYLAAAMVSTTCYALAYFAPVYLLSIWREDDLTDRLQAAEEAAQANEVVAGEMVFTEEELEAARRVVEGTASPNN